MGPSPLKRWRYRHRGDRRIPRSVIVGVGKGEALPVGALERRQAGGMAIGERGRRRHGGSAAGAPAQPCKLSRLAGLPGSRHAAGVVRAKRRLAAGNSLRLPFQGLSHEPPTSTCLSAFAELIYRALSRCATRADQLCAQAATGRRVRSIERTQTLYVTGRLILAGAVARVLVIARTRRELRLVQDQPLQLVPVHVRQGVHQRLPRCHPGPRDQNNLPW